MTQNEIIKRIKRQADALRTSGATSLFIYGSRARGEERPDSDLDVFVDYDPKSKFSLLDLVRLKHIIEDDLRLEVHIATRDGLKPQIREEVEQDAVQVF